MSFASLPYELLLKIFSNFDSSSLCRASQVCITWRQCSSDKALLDVHLQQNIDHCFYFLKTINKKIKELIRRSAQVAQKREEFLQETLQLINSYLKRRLVKPIYSKDLNNMLIALWNLLHQTDKILQQPKHDSSDVDLIELALRRQIEQLMSMYSSTSLSGSQLIQDVKARFVWEEFIGKNESCLQLSSFMEMTSKIFPNCNNLALLQSQLLFLLNFPQDDMLTVYKWNLLVEQFGPYDQLQEHLESFCVSGGFLGMINRVRAEEILMEHSPVEKLVLIRFSRTQPSHLAFSWKDGNRLFHSLNTKRYPLRSFLEKSFKGFTFVPVRIKPTRANDIHSFLPTSGYVSSEISENSRYFTLEFESVLPKKRKISTEELNVLKKCA